MHKLRLEVAAVAVLCVGLGLTIPVAVLAQGRASTPTAQPEVQRLGPQVGQKVPDFTLTDQDGRERPLHSLMGEQGLILVFSRSADW